MSYEQLKKAALKQKQINSSINKTLDQGQQPPLPNKRNLNDKIANFKKKESTEKGEKSNEQPKSEGNIEITGNSLVKICLFSQGNKRKNKMTMI